MATLLSSGEAPSPHRGQAKAAPAQLAVLSVAPLAPVVHVSQKRRLQSEALVPKATSAVSPTRRSESAVVVATRLLAALPLVVLAALVVHVSRKRRLQSEALVPPKTSAVSGTRRLAAVVVPGVQSHRCNMVGSHLSRRLIRDQPLQLIRRRSRPSHSRSCSSWPPCRQGRNRGCPDRRLDP